MYRQSALATLFLSLLLSAAAPARAQESHSRVVRYGDLDLSSPVGVKALHHRITHAAVAVCRASNTGDAPLDPVQRQCRRLALADVQQEVRDAIQLAEAKAATQLALR